LGKISFDNFIKVYKTNYSFNKKLIFKHGKRYKLPDGKILISSYHPSPRNVNTKLINLKMITLLFTKAKKIS
jgi:uracil-DNA glycosylase